MNPNSHNLTANDEPKTTTIIFDWGRVLIDSPTPGILSHCQKILGIAPDVFMKAYREVEFGFYHGTITEPQFWQMLFESAALELPDRCLQEENSFWLEAFKTGYRPRPEMFELLAKLKQAGYQLGLLSNTELPVMELFKEDRYKIFDFAVFSCVEQTAKPDEPIYQIALKRAQNLLPHTQMHNCIFIDDKIENTTAAQALNMKAIHYTDFNVFLAALNRLGVIFS